VYKILIGNPQKNRLLQLPKRKCDDNIEMNVREIEYEDVNWIQFSHHRI
jgi:hypothetical protein